MGFLMTKLIANKLFIGLIASILSFSISGFYFHGVGFDKASLAYEKDIALVKDIAKQKYESDIEEIIAQADIRIANEEKRLRRLKPVEREVIKYVTENKGSDISQCAITDDGLHVLSRYLAASFNP
jgi:hypothetical protein